MKNTNLFTPEEKDFIREMMNIGAGNAATALSQLLACTVNMEIPAVTVLPITEVSNLFAEPSVITTGVKMQMIGDIAGDLYFLLPSENVAQLVDRAQTALAGGRRAGNLIFPPSWRSPILWPATI